MKSIAVENSSCRISVTGARKAMFTYALQDGKVSVRLTAPTFHINGRPVVAALKDMGGPAGPPALVGLSASLGTPPPATWPCMAS